MKYLPSWVKSALQKISRKLPAENKLPFFTLSFTLATLIITIVAVQQQQTLTQEAAEICPTETSADGTATNPTTEESETATRRTAEEREATRAARRQGRNGNSETSVVTSAPETNITIIRTTEAPTIVIGGGSSVGRKSEKIKGQLIVKYKPGKSKRSVEEKVKKRKGRVKKRLERLRMDVVQVPENEEAATIGELRRDENVESIYNDYTAFGGFTPNDPDFNKQYGLKKISAPQAWDVIKGNKNIKIAILDTGIDKNHPDLSGKIVSEKNFLDNGPATDNNGHGTHVAGIAVAAGNNNKGIIGVCPECSILVGKVLDGNMSGPVSGIIEGIDWAVANDAKVISMSLGVAQDRSVIKPLEDAVNQASGRGVVVVAMAGNCGDGNFGQNHCSRQNQEMYPGAYDSVIAVGATDANDKKASFSTTGSYVDVSAPGVNVYSAAPNGGFKESSGTSQATPHVAGLAGLLLSQGMSAQEVKQKILNSADSLQNAGSQKGRINAAKAVGADTTEPSGANDPTPTGASDNNGDPTSTERPNRNKTKKPCKPVKDKKAAKPTKTPKANRNNGTSDPLGAACNMFPNLPGCSGRRKKDCVTNPSQNTRNRNSGSGRDGQTSTSNNEGTRNIGNINSDGTTDTRININGQTQTTRGGTTGTGEDINTGGRTGGNTRTEINIDRSGGTERVDRSGGSNNQKDSSSGDCPEESGGSNTTNDKDRNKNQNKNEQDARKNARKESRSSGGGMDSLLCRYAPFLRRCSRDRSTEKEKKEKDKKAQEEKAKKEKKEKDKKAQEEKAKKEKEDKKKKEDEKKKKNVKGASDDQLILFYNSLVFCITTPSCSEEQKTIADLNNDDKVSTLDYEIFITEYSSR